jgi:hypothetical protein
MGGMRGLSRERREAAEALSDEWKCYEMNDITTIKVLQNPQRRKSRG